MTNAHKFPARARGWKWACLELAEQYWSNYYSSDEKVWGVGKGDSPLKLLHVYRVYDTKGYGKVL